MDRRASTGFLGALAAAALGVTATAGIPYPDGFEPLVIADGLTKPVGIAFAQDGRMFIAEQRGMVWVMDGGVILDEPFIDLRDEINEGGDRGLLGLTLDPQFLVNRQVYLLYVVDPIFGPPNESPTTETFSRLTRYTGTEASDGNQADPASRLVLIGQTPGEGIPACHSSHTIGSLRFGLDGSLFVSAGDGAHYELVDDGGFDPPCFAPGMFGEDQNIGAFRAQYLSSLAGKVLRVDPATGLGLSSNPHWTGDGDDNRSRVWVNGLRNPYRFAVRPGSAAAGMPGTLYVGDVGWFSFEEMNVAYGGENFGWPCEEGTGAAPSYPNSNPDHSDCSSIETPENPGPLTGPLLAWDHGDGSQSCPPGPRGRAASGAVFYEGVTYPVPYRDALFFADLMPPYPGWIKVARVDQADQLIELLDFTQEFGQVVDLRADPITDDVCFVLLQGQIARLVYDVASAADVNEDGVVDIQDLIEVVLQWGPCPAPPAACDADIDLSGVVDVSDMVTVLLNWS